jgi:hypothetical protein
LDEDKAAKCYIGALKLNPLNAEAGWALSEIYMSKGGVWCGVVWCGVVRYSVVLFLLCDRVL